MPINRKLVGRFTRLQAAIVLIIVSVLTVMTPQLTYASSDILSVCQTGDCMFRAVNDALVHAGDGTQIMIGAGVYPESVSLTKKVSLVGSEGTILTGDSVSGAIISATGTEATITGVTFDPAQSPASTATVAISALGSSLHVDNDTFHNLATALTSTGGSLAADSNTASGTDAFLASTGDTGLELTRNTLSGTNNTDAALISILHGNHIRVTGNVLQGEGVGSGVVFEASGDSTDVSVTSNTIKDFDTAVKVEALSLHDPMTPLRSNDFSGSSVGVVSDPSNQVNLVDASGNWWGTKYGPSDPASATATNVVSEPWCADSGCSASTNTTLSPMEGGSSTPGMGGGPVIVSPSPVDESSSAPSNGVVTASAVSTSSPTPALLGNPVAAIAYQEMSSDTPTSSQGSTLGGQTQVDTNTQAVPEVAGKRASRDDLEFFGLAWYWWLLIVILLSSAGYQLYRGIKIDRM